MLGRANRDSLSRALGHGSPRNIVFGFHYYYCGGRSYSSVASRSIDEVLDEIEASRPGDHFTLFSLAVLADLAEMRATIRRDEPATLEEVVSAVRKASVSTELVIVFDTDTPAVDVLYDLDDRDARETHLEWLARGDGDVYVFRMDLLDQGSDGSVVSTVSPHSGNRRVHALVDGKRPTADGRTPERGTY